MIKYDNIVRKYIVRNRPRSIAIILSIALSMALIVGVGVLSYSARQADIDKLRYETGRGHVSYENVSAEQVNNIKSHSSLLQNIGVYSYYGFGSSSGHSTYLACADSGYMRMMGSQLLKGRFPRHAGEIALERWNLNQLGVKPELNQKISMEVNYEGQRHQEEF